MRANTTTPTCSIDRRLRLVFISTSTSDVDPLVDEFITDVNREIEQNIDNTNHYDNSLNVEYARG